MSALEVASMGARALVLATKNIRVGSWKIFRWECSSCSMINMLETAGGDMQICQNQQRSQVTR